MLKLPSLPSSPERPERETAMPSDHFSDRLNRTAPQLWSNNLPPSIRPQNWTAQGAVAVEGMASGKYRSAAIHCEVKLAEALAKASKGKHKDEHNLTKPNGFRTAVCMQMFNELCDLCGPFSTVMARVRDELVKSIYSDYYATGDGSLNLEQTPFFMVVGRLEAEKDEMIAERERFRQELLERAEDIEVIEHRMASLEENVRSERERNSNLSAELEQTNDKLNRAKAEARQTKDELKRLRKDLLRAKEDMARMRANGGIDLVDLDELEQLRRSSSNTQRELTRVMGELEAERNEKLEMVPREELESATSKIEDMKEQMEAMRHALLGEGSKDRAKQGKLVLTPRPDWEGYPPNDVVIEGKSSKNIAQELVLALNQISGAGGEDGDPNHESNFLLLPDPDPDRMPSLQPMIDAAESNVDPENDEAYLPDSRIPVLGAGPEVPRYLRCPQPTVPITPMNKRDTKKFVHEVWASKKIHDTNRRAPTSLLEFVFVHLRETMTSQVQVAAFSHNLHLSLTKYNFDSDIELFLRVLEGTISEEARLDRESLRQGLKLMLYALDAQTNGGETMTKATTGLVSRDDIHLALGNFFPAKSETGVTVIRRALREEVAEDDAKVRYEELFESDDDLAQGPFLEAVLDQHIAEIVEYAAGLEASLVQAAETEAGKASAAKQCSLSTIRAAIIAYEASKSPSEVDQYMLRGARISSLADLHFQEKLGATCDVKKFVMRLRTGLVKRSNNFDLRAIHKLQNSKNSGVVSGPAHPAVA
ncbi:hypothetical protein CYMTET_49645 [Cymbomonas tetramitiformis]|uniref:Uncharacterized protein n=1 Tax=Cymbomonas tetramitiformis TaxID=36881 RepID=A0AAE0EUC3_9CHLO|nr:hypothetical protein CYMTET_49645 [Cymbomonas tetramitiformis]